MFVGAVGNSDRAARAVVDTIAGWLPDASVSCTVAGGVAIACWTGPGIGQSTFAGDHAFVGAVRGEFPTPTTELRGGFALVARRGNHLRLARGRFGGRPLYWARVGSTTVACSRLLPLAWLSRSAARLNMDHVLGLFDAKFWLLRGPLPFVAVERVFTNAVVDIDAAGVVKTSRGPVEIGAELRLSTRDSAAALRHEFEAAVSRECAGVPRVAIFAGGGVDSSNLLAVALRIARQNEKTDVLPVALDFGGPGDDRPHLRAICAHLGVDPVRVPPAEGAPFGGQERVVDGSAHAVGPLSTVLAAMARAKEAGAGRALSGDGAEWLLDASPPVFGDFLLHHPVRALVCARRFQSVHETRQQSWRRLVVGPLLRHILPPFALTLRQAQVRSRTAANNRRALSWAGPRLKSFLATPRAYPSTPAIHSQRARVIEAASSELLMTFRETCSRWEIASGLQLSLPYLDDDYARFVARVPSAAIFAGARERGLLRESMEGLIPDSVRYRTDKSRADHAFAELFGVMGGYDAFADIITMRELEALGIVDAKGFRADFKRFAADPYADSVQWGTLWTAITAEAYVRWFDDFKAEKPPFATSLQPGAAFS